MLAPEGLQVGDPIARGQDAPVRVGNTLYLKDIPIGSSIYNREIQEHQGAKLVRSAGTRATLLRKEEETVLVRLPSGERRRVSHHCTATIGQVGCADHLLEVIGKAGRRRNKG